MLPVRTRPENHFFEPGSSRGKVMIKLIWNLLALTGLVLVAGLVWIAMTYGFGMQDIKNLKNLREFDPMSPQVYMDMTKTLLATGNAAEATVWRRPVADGLSATDVEDTMRFDQG
jgi:hypothetical protein